MKLLKNLRKRGLALFMALVMCLSLLPATAMAEEAGSASATLTPDPVKDDNVIISKKAERGETPGTWTVTLGVTTKKNISAVSNLDVVLVLDDSLSMIQNPTQTINGRDVVSYNYSDDMLWHKVIRSAESLVTSLKTADAASDRKIRVGLVTFHGTASVQVLHDTSTQLDFDAGFENVLEQLQYMKSGKETECATCKAAATAPDGTYKSPWETSAVAIGNFCGKSEIHTGLVQEAGYVTSSNMNYNNNAGTNMTAGLQAAKDMLSGSTAKKVIVFLTDGDPSQDVQFCDAPTSENSK